MNDSTIVRAHQHSPGAQKSRRDEAIGRSRSGLNAKIHTLVVALGNPTGSYLTGEQVHDLVGASHLLPSMKAGMPIVDKAFNAGVRVLARSAAAGKTAVILPRANCRLPRDFDRDIYEARHRIENFFAKIKQFCAIATRYEKTAKNFLAAVYLVATVSDWIDVMH